MHKLKLMLPLLIAGSLVLTACSQHLSDSKIPVAVKNSFANDYPGTSATWNKEDPDYEASFKMERKQMSVLYDLNGNKKESETEIQISDLPAPVRDYISQHYNGEKIKEAAVITKANGEINYEAEVKGKDLLFRRDGSFIQKTSN